MGEGDGLMEMAALGDGGDGVGDPDRPAVEVADGVADVDAPATATDVAAAVGEADVASCVVKGLSAIDPLDVAATTPTPSASSPAIAMIGTRANRLPRGRRSRQFGQNPETGVVT